MLTEASFNPFKSDDIFHPLNLENISFDGEVISALFSGREKSMRVRFDSIVAFRVVNESDIIETVSKITSRSSIGVYESVDSIFKESVRDENLGAWNYDGVGCYLFVSEILCLEVLSYDTPSVSFSKGP